MDEEKIIRTIYNIWLNNESRHLKFDDLRAKAGNELNELSDQQLRELINNNLNTPEFYNLRASKNQISCPIEDYKRLCINQGRIGLTCGTPSNMTNIEESELLDYLDSIKTLPLRDNEYHVFGGKPINMIYKGCGVGGFSSILYPVQVGEDKYYLINRKPVEEAQLDLSGLPTITPEKLGSLKEAGSWKGFGFYTEAFPRRGIDMKTLQDESLKMKNTRTTLKESRKTLDEADNNVKLHVEFYPYDRYGDSDGKKKANLSAPDMLTALKKLVDKMLLYIDSEKIEDEGYTPEEVIEQIQMSNGDGCDYITLLQEMNSGDILIQEDYDEEEDWDDMDESFKRTGEALDNNENKLRESNDVVTIGIYGDEVPGLSTVSGIVNYFKNKGIEVSDVSGDTDYGWEMNLTGDPRKLFFAVVNTIPGYNSDSVSEFIDEYRIDESLDDDSDFEEFVKNHPDYNKKFNRAKFGKYFDKNGQLLKDKEEEFMSKLMTGELNEDLDNVESTDNTVVIDQPMGAAEKESKNLWQRFIDATKEPEDAPLFGAKKQPKPDEVKEPKAEMEESLNKKSNRRLKESLDGWDEEKVYDIIDICDEIYNLNYELKNCVKGAYTRANTYSELADYVVDLGQRLAEEGEELRYVGEDPEDEEDDIDESLNKNKLREGSDDENATFNVGDKFRLNFPEGDFAEIAILDTYKNGRVKWRRIRPDYKTVTKISPSEYLKWWLDYNNFVKVNESLSSKLTLDESLFESRKLAEGYYPDDFDEDLEEEWTDMGLDFDRDRPGKYDFSTAGQAIKALSAATSFGYRDSWREGNQVYIAGYDESTDEYHIKESAEEKPDKNLEEASTLPKGGRDQKYDTDAWSVIYWELSKESGGLVDPKMRRRAKVNAPVNSRYEHVDPVNDFDLRVYASDESGFDLAKKIADAWGVKYKIENTNGVHANKFPEEKLQMTLLIPEEMIG